MKKRDNAIVIGADIGGSHITTALVDINNKCLTGEVTRNTVNSKSSKEIILENWVNAIRATTINYDGKVDKVAFAMPGPFDYVRGISLIKGLDKYDSIYGINIRNYIAEEIDIPKENILFRNDAEAFLHGEMFCGAGRDEEKAIGLTLGTGFGSAINYNGVTADLNLGSVPFRKSIADDYFSTRWFINRYWEDKGVKPLDVKEFLCLADDDVQTQIFEEFTLNLSEFIAPYLKKENISTVIFGGNITRASHLFLPLLKRKMLKQDLNITFKLAELNEEAALIGAAASFEGITVA
ncbi:ROK family protein [Pelobium manganitolerans]|uniref:ROK family protein n=1 Tax=Pelobium manganitolerans TaxID=1842495 RepID=UPI003FA3D148